MEGVENTEALELIVKPFMTFRELKYEVFKLINIPMFLQNWIINDQYPQSDRQRMIDFNVNHENHNTLFLKKGNNINKTYEKPVECDNNNNNTIRPERKFEDLIKLSSRPLVCNVECFECSICYTDTAPGDGVVLRGCLHYFCKECLVNTIKFSEDFAVSCPFVNDEFKCEALLHEREIKTLLTTELWEKHLTKSLRVAQGNIENAFFCQTPNCKGWCVTDDNTNDDFACPICNAKNCIGCKAIHPRFTCKEYQDLANADSTSKGALEAMITRGEAMHCPKCKVSFRKSH